MVNRTRKPRLVILSESGEELDSCELSWELYHHIKAKGKEFGGVQAYIEKLITDCAKEAKPCRK